MNLNQRLSTTDYAEELQILLSKRNEHNPMIKVDLKTPINFRIPITVCWCDENGNAEIDIDDLVNKLTVK